MKKISIWNTMSISGAMLNSGSAISSSRMRMGELRRGEALVDLDVEGFRPAREALDASLQVVVEDDGRDRDRESGCGRDERLVDAVRQQLRLAETFLRRDRREREDQSPHGAEEPEKRRDDVDHEQRLEVR